ncbi:MAG: hypothetical protein RQ824_09600 [bacterium]|nr:hypothetical protein [bacterium]
MARIGREVAAGLPHHVADWNGFYVRKNRDRKKKYVEISISSFAPHLLI